MVFCNALQTSEVRSACVRRRLYPSVRGAVECSILSQQVSSSHCQSTTSNLPRLSQLGSRPCLQRSASLHASFCSNPTANDARLRNA